MRIKTYTSDSVPQALKQIHSELGPGAVILKTNRTVKKKFMGLIPTSAYEITAASDPASEQPSEDKKEEKDEILKLADSIQDETELEDGMQTRVSKKIEGSTKVRVETYEAATTPPEERRSHGNKDYSKHPPFIEGPYHSETKWMGQIEKIGSDIENLIRLISRQNANQPLNSLLMRKDFLTEQFQRMIRQSVDNSKQAAVVYSEFQKLTSEGVDENLAFLILQEASKNLPSDQDIEERIWLRLNRTISRSIEVSQFNPATGPKACIFVGPTGVGKTTTLAKVAARMALKERQKVKLITFDTYRIAAAEQLKVYGEIIGVPVRVIFSLSELKEAVKDIRSDECVLIDTTGHSHKRVAEYSELASYVRNNNQVEKHLVLSTTTRPQDLSEAIESFEIFGPEKLVFTKLDETSSHGVILNELVRTEKPLSYLTDGQDVAEDLIIPSETTLADLLMPIC